MIRDILLLLKNLQVDATTAILIGFCFVIIYLGWRTIKLGVDALELADTIAVFLSTFSVLGGLRVIIFGLENEVCHLATTEQTYIVIGGGAVIWNSCKTLRKKWTEGYKDLSLKKEDQSEASKLAET